MTRKSGKGKPRQTIRAEEDLWLRFDESTAAAGSDRSEVLREFMRWHAGDPNARLPRRPANAVRWTGKNFDEVKAIRPDARLAEVDDPESQVVAGDLLIERVNEPGTWVVVGRNYVVYRRESVTGET
ncbi:hypothetical protein [Plantactinospora sp. WMMB782]|uniref:hypothetical protein n=1 Tax=Plantactinospora sp. WMMB782 TaxID=3404121 RepID=UPI003B92EC29